MLRGTQGEVPWESGLWCDVMAVCRLSLAASGQLESVVQLRAHTREISRVTADRQRWSSSFPRPSPADWAISYCPYSSVNHDKICLIDEDCFLV